MTEIAGASEREVWTTVQALNRAWAIDREPERLDTRALDPLRAPVRLPTEPRTSLNFLW
jgi:hypothetical protein